MVKLSQLNKQEKLILILRVACFFLFMARAWQHLFWDAPFRSILWNEGMLKGFVESYLGMSWTEYTTSPLVDHLIQSSIKAFGFFYLFIAVFSLKVKTVKYVYFLYFSTLSLFFLAFLSFVEKFFYVGMLIEYSLQFGAPMLLALVLTKKMSPNLIFLFKILIAGTFLGHGLFALGYYPTPGHFIDMIITVLGTRESEAIILLRIAGGLDILTVICLFIPRFSIYALGFASFWGIVTAWARALSHIQVDTFLIDSHQWLFEVFCRFPHGLIPLGVLLFLKNKKVKK